MPLMDKKKISIGNRNLMTPLDCIRLYGLIKRKHILQSRENMSYRNSLNFTKQFSACFLSDCKLTELRFFSVAILLEPEI